MQSGDEPDDSPDAGWARRSHSPNPPILQSGSSFAQRVGSFLSGVDSAVSPGLSTDEEFEGEAEHDREHSRREAERVLTQEAEERRLMEEKVFAMMQPAHGSPNHISPARSQAIPPFERPSPTTSQCESATKNCLVPTEESLTVAQ